MLHLFRSLVHPRRQGSAAASLPRKKPSARPLIEVLEDRLAPAIFNVGAGDSAGLVAAITAANNEGVNFGPDTIRLAASTYNFSAFSADNFWYGRNALPAISSNITIEGNGATLNRTDNGTLTTDALRFFFVSGGQSGLAAGTLTLQNLTLQNGLAKGGDSQFGGGGMGAGGAIFSQGNVTLSGVTLSGNTARGGLAGFSNATETGGGGMGQDSQGLAGGGFGGPFPGAVGGTGGVGLGASAGGGGGFTALANGGGGGTVTGGGVTGLGSGTGDGGDGGNGGGFGGHFGNGAAGGGTGGFGGGGGQRGGGQPGGFGGGFGGGLGGGGAGLGGAVFVHAGRLDVINSTLSGNSARGGTSSNGQSGSGLGGAIFNLNGVVNVTQSTIAGNTVTTSVPSGFTSSGVANGGAIYNLAFGNTIDTGAAVSATLTLVNSIVASAATHDIVNEANHSRSRNGTSNTATVTATTPNIVLARNNIGTNATNNASGILAGVTAGSLNLGPLQNNGGLTQTMVLGAGSAARNAGSNANVPGGVTTDQRGAGFARLIGTVDLGAFEDQAQVPAAAPAAPAAPKRHPARIQKVVVKVGLVKKVTLNVLSAVGVVLRSFKSKAGQKIALSDRTGDGVLHVVITKRQNGKTKTTTLDGTTL